MGEGASREMGLGGCRVVNIVLAMFGKGHGLCIGPLDLGGWRCLGVYTRWDCSMGWTSRVGMRDVGCGFMNSVEMR